ncbi:MAG: hypothetical protein JNK71_08905 [Methyloversatilis sp.]|nr:hypothetical protein [Methyloversatilis sp.]
MSANEGTPKVLVVVSGGNAYFAAEGAVEIAIFDCDNYRADPMQTAKVPKGFTDLALRLGVDADAIQASSSMVARHDPA